VFGQSAALKGPAGALGLGMREGILAAFHEANASGGVHGRKLELISYNDDYEPEVAIAKTNKLIEEDKVFALIGEVGTPTSKAVQPIATEGLTKPHTPSQNAKRFLQWRKRQCP
jgi:branched-chain amino acid transport system substrate-binding protein